MVSIYTFVDALFAERVATLSYMGISVGFTAYHTLGKFMDNIIDAYLEGLVVTTFFFTELWHYYLLQLFLWLNSILWILAAHLNINMNRRTVMNCFSRSSQSKFFSLSSNHNFFHLSSLYFKFLLCSHHF